MCHERHVANDYKLCGHTVRLPDEFIECGKPNCRYSAYHNPNCANCLQTCQQIRGYPEQYRPLINRYCPSCTAILQAQQQQQSGYR